MTRIILAILGIAIWAGLSACYPTTEYRGPDAPPVGMNTAPPDQAQADRDRDRDRR
jgi:hypothetical protein